MRKSFFGFFGAALLLIAAVLYFIPPRHRADSPTLTQPPPLIVTPPPSITIEDQQFAEEIKVASPITNELITSPVTVKGEGRGFWFFEASMPVSILDADKKVLAKVPVTARGEWMTENFVLFEGSIPFTSPAMDTGYILFENDNPSGMPEHAKSFLLPIRFR